MLSDRKRLLFRYALGRPSSLIPIGPPTHLHRTAAAVVPPSPAPCSQAPRPPPPDAASRTRHTVAGEANPPSPHGPRSGSLFALVLVGFPLLTARDPPAGCQRRECAASGTSR